MMTPEERVRQEARARRLAAMGEEGEMGVGGLITVAERFPIPKTDGLTPAEAEATLTRWRAEVHKFVADREAASRAAHQPAPRAAAS